MHPCMCFHTLFVIAKTDLATLPPWSLVAPHGVLPHSAGVDQVAAGNAAMPRHFDIENPHWAGGHGPGRQLVKLPWRNCTWPSGHNPRRLSDRDAMLGQKWRHPSVAWATVVPTPWEIWAFFMLGDHVHKGDVQSPKIYWFIMVYHHFPKL